MKKLAIAAALGALVLPSFASAQQETASEFPSPGQIVAEAPAPEWVQIAAEDLLVMDLAPDRDGKARRVVIQLMPPPFSQGWIGNIRKLAAAHWWDGTGVNRVQDNYVVQWGDATEKKPLPDGLATVPESEYITTAEAISEANAEIIAIETEPGEIETVADALAVLGALTGESEAKKTAALSLMAATRTDRAPEGLHQRDAYAEWVEIYDGWPVAAEKRGDSWDYWPVHCYGMVGVGRNLSPDTGSGAELYTVIGQAPRHLDRNIALVGRVIEGMENLSSLPRGSGDLGFYEDPAQRVPIVSVRLASDMPEAPPASSSEASGRGKAASSSAALGRRKPASSREAAGHKERPSFEYLSTEGPAFARYAEARANRRDPFFNVPAGGADICNIPVPVRKVTAD